MKIDRQVIDFLKTYFVPRRGDSHVAGSIIPGGTNTYNLGASTNRWDTIYARQVVADSLTGGGGAANADTLDGFHASLTPTPSTILPLDASQKYPTTTYPDAILRNGTRSLTGDLAVSSGVKIDGIDISAHAVDASIHHIGGMTADSHTQYMHISQNRTVSAAHTYQPGAPSPPFYLGTNAQDQWINGLYADRALDLDRYVVAGMGLTGGGQLTGGNVTLDVGGSANISVGADAINLTTPGQLDVTSTSQAATAHTHGITASNNPGVATALLKSGSDGSLYLGGDFGVDSDTLYVDVSEDAVYINAGTLPSRRGALTVHPAVSSQRGLVLEQLSGQSVPILQVFDYSGNDLILLTSDGDLESGNPGFVSGLTGWQITHTGNAEFWNAFIRGELHASIFVADEMHATGGTNVVVTSGKVADPGTSGNNVMGSTDSQFTLRIQASWDTGLSYFSVDDVIRFKFMGDSGGGLDLWDVFVEVDSVGSITGRNLSEGDPGYFPMTVRRRSGGSSGLEIPAGTGGVLWGNVSGSGYSGSILLTSDLNQSPYIDIFTVDNYVTYAPWNPLSIKPRVRLGNLDGVLGLPEQWGIAFGEDLSDTSKPYAVFSDLQASTHGIEQSWWDLDGNIRGAVDPSATGSGKLFWLGVSESDPGLVFSGDGLLTIKQGFLGPYHDVTFGSGLLWVPPLGNKYTGWLNYRNWINFEEPTTDTGSSHAGPGKYGAAFAVGRTGWNYLVNAAFTDSVAEWTKVGTGTLTWASSTYFNSNGSARLTAGTADTYIYNAAPITTAVSVPNNGYVTAYCYMYISSGVTPGQGRIRIYDRSSSTYRATSSNTVAGSWELVRVSWLNTTGAAKNVEVRLSNNYNNSSTYVWFDSVMLELGAYYNCFFDKEYGGWPGIAYNVDIGSSRTKQHVGYSINLPTNAYTISCWFTPLNECSLVTGSARVFEWYGDADDRVILYSNATADRYTAYHQAAGSTATINSPTDPTVGVPHHFLMTFNGSRLYFYVDGSYVSDVAASQSFGTIPSTFYLGTDYAGNNENAGGYISDLFIISDYVDADGVTSIYSAADPVSVINDFTFRVSRPNYGSTILAPEGVFITDRYGTNILVANTGIVPLDLEGTTLQPGDLIIGRSNVGYPGGSWLFHNSGSYSLSYNAFDAWGAITYFDQNGELSIANSSFLGSEGLHFYNLNNRTPKAQSILWELGAYLSGAFMQVYGRKESTYEHGVVSISSGSRYAQLELLDYTTPSASITLSVSDGAGRFANIGILASSATGGGRITLGGTYVDLTNATYVDFTGVTNIYADVNAIYFHDSTKYVREPSGGTDRVGRLYVPLTSMIPSANYYWGGTVSGTSGVYRTVSTEWPGIPANVAAAVFRIHARDSATHPLTDEYFQLGPANAANQYDHLSVHPPGSNMFASAQGIVTVTSNTVYLKWSTAGTMYVWLSIVGYFI